MVELDQGAPEAAISGSAPPSAASASQSQSNFSATIMYVLRNRRASLWRAGGFGLISSLLLAFLLPVRFDSTTRIIPDNSAKAAQGILGTLGKVAGSGVTADMLGLKSDSGLMIGILQSQTMQDYLIDRFNLLQVYRVRYHVSARKTLAKNTRIDDDRQSGIITITVTDHDRYRAAEMTRAYVAELNVISAMLDTSSARKEREFIGEQLDIVRKNLDQAEADLSNFSSTNATLDVKEQAKAIVGTAAQIQGELIAAQVQQKGLAQNYSPDNYRVRAANADVAELQRELTHITGDLNQQQSDPGGDYPSLRQLPLLGLRYAELYRRVETQETVFGFLTQQFETAKIEEARDVPTVRILDPGDVAERKSFPPRTLIVILCTLLCIVVTASWMTIEVSDDESLASVRKHILNIDKMAVALKRHRWISFRRGKTS